MLQISKGLIVRHEDRGIIGRVEKDCTKKSGDRIKVSNKLTYTTIDIRNNELIVKD